METYTICFWIAGIFMAIGACGLLHDKLFGYEEEEIHEEQIYSEFEKWEENGK